MALASPEVLKAILITAELSNKPLSREAAHLIATDLAPFPEAWVLEALAKCRQDLNRWPTIADIVERLPDGRPGVEEAWSILPKSEDVSVVWTDEMAEAFGIVRALIEEDEIAARMAFKETYSKLLREARAKGIKPNWTASLGHNKSLRDGAIVEAIQKNRITADQAQALLGYVPVAPGAAQRQIETPALVKRLAHQAVRRMSEEETET